MLIKQVIVIRKDLKMRKGKMCAQAAHASLKVFTDIGNISDNIKGVSNCTLQVPLTPEMKEWITGIYTKICVYVESEEDLLDIYEQARHSNIPISLVQDIGKTEFHNIHTYTCVAIGPAESSIIDKITGHLPLL